MPARSKEAILAAYNDLVREMGVEVREEAFTRETGISSFYWWGRYWRSWSEFQAAAAVHSPRPPVQRIPDAGILQRYAELVLELDRIPTNTDLDFKRSRDRSFPDKLSLRRWKSRSNLLLKVMEYCEGKQQFEPVLQLLRRDVLNSLNQRLETLQIKGFVYLLRADRTYKLSRMNAAGEKLRELAVQLPEEPDIVHVIETDDPEGIEQYWKRRFAKIPRKGEWLRLTAEDLNAFKKRKFQ